jgi:hypothetical protein
VSKANETGSWKPDATVARVSAVTEVPKTVPDAVGSTDTVPEELSETNRSPDESKATAVGL